MQLRINYRQMDSMGLKLMFQFEEFAKTTSIDYSLRELIKLRASQINGCAYCINMHTQDARKAGETEQRLYCLSAWRECPFYSEAERAALELTEAVTLIAQQGVPEELYNRVRAHFSEQQYVELIFLINTINSWNRISISVGNFPQEIPKA